MKMGEKRQTGLTLTPIMWAYVEQARLTGLYGDATSAVLRNLILAALRRALENGIILRVTP
jgi:hypothetical protein